ncbi:MAG: hypothetical protein GC178_00490 [Flavobacteriales bacterium]|nr:hypothetical protein [Flavobacteriales bacterium]
MNGYTFNSNPPAFSPAWEAFALRAGLCLLDNVCCVGYSTNIIMFEHASEQLTPANKMRLLLKQLQQPEDIKTLQGAMAIMQSIRKKKHRNKHDILTLKRGEKITQDIFEHYREHIVTDLRTSALPQLWPFYLKDNKCLYLWNVDTERGEPTGRGKFSGLLSFEQDEEEEDPPSIVLFYEQLGLDVLDRFECTPLVTLPNMNLYEYEKLNNLRQRLEPLRKELETTLPLMEQQDGEKRYTTGQWNIESIKELAPRLQKTMDELPEIQWAADLQQSIRAELLVGNMEITELWQLLFDHGIIPKDTWAVLQKKKQSGILCPTIPFITVRSDWSTAATDNLTEEDSLSHKRKTLDLD